MKKSIYHSCLNRSERFCFVYPGKPRSGLCMLLFVLGTFLSAQTSFAQTVIPAVTGTVTDVLGKPLSGVTISVMGKGAAVTNREGKFSIKNVQDNVTLHFRYVGYTPVEVKLTTDQKEIHVKLVQAINMLNEVVVNTGLYKRPIESFTGDAHTMTGEELKMVNPVSVIKGLAVMDPSFRIMENNAMGSDPNTLPVIQLRGQNNLPLNVTSSNLAASVSQGDIMSGYVSNPNQPLIVIDGFQSSLQALYDLDINRIERVTILKDAVATVAYGSKAANGVIVVDTKKPVSGRLQVTYAVGLNASVPDLTSYHLLDANGLLAAQKSAGIYTYKGSNANDLALQQWYDQRLLQVKGGVNTDWLAQPVRNGIGVTNSVNVSGGNNAVRFSLSLSYNNNAGVMKGSNRNTYGITNYISYAGNKIRVSNSTSIVYNKSRNSLYGSYSSYANAFPYFRTTDSSGSLLKVLEPASAQLNIPIGAPGGNGAFTNPLYNAILPGRDFTGYLGFSNMTNIELILNRNLRITGAANISTQLPQAQQLLTADNTAFVNASLAGFADLGSYTQTTGKNVVFDSRLGLDYNQRWNRHTLYLSVGTTAQATNSSSTTITEHGLPSDQLTEPGMVNGYNATDIKPSAGFNRTHTLSVYASASYNYLERYVAEVTVNGSGSSQFGSNNRIAPFFAYGLGWNIDKESFFHPNKIVQRLRLKATYGVTGNQNFAAALAQPTFQYNTANNYRLQLGSMLMAYANQNLKWQQTDKWNISMQATLFNNKLNAAASFYIENTNNLILPLGIDPSTGFTTYQDNLGATQNIGYEINLSSIIIQNRKKNFVWALTFNAGHYNNVIKSLSPAILALNQGNDKQSANQSAPLPRYQVGQSLTEIWAVKSLGIDPATGNELFQKLNGTTSFNWSAADRQPVGNAADKIKGAFGSNLMYKGFVLNIMLSYAYGGQMYNQTLVDKVENVNLATTNADSRVLTGRWKQPGDQAAFKSIAINNGTTLATSRFVQDNNYIDAASITIGYNFPSTAAWIRKLHLSAPRLFITQNEVFRLATIQLERGTNYPFARNFSLGLSTSF